MRHTPPPQFSDTRTFADVSAGVLDRGVAVDIGQQSEAEPVFIVGRISEAVHKHTGWRGLVTLSNAIVKFIVDDGAPVARLLVLHWLQIWKRGIHLDF